MATTKYYLDRRSTRADGTHPLKLQVAHRGRNTLLSVDVYLTDAQWDGQRVTKQHPRHLALNKYLTGLRDGIEARLLEMRGTGELDRMTMPELKAALTGRQKSPTGGFMTALDEFAHSHANKGTCGLYEATARRIRAFCADADTLTFADITREWLTRFDAFLALTAPSANARGIHLRNIRAVFNRAIDNEVTTLYPFRRYKIKSQPTAKRSLPVEDLRRLFALTLEPWQQKYLDMFKLIFFLCGINIGDLCKLTGITYGRVEYTRAKTGRPYSVKVEPEAMEIISRYRGAGHLLDILDTYGDYHDFAHRMNDNLKYLGGTRSEMRVAADGKRRMVTVREVTWPGLSTYWARHSWATIAASLDIPKETIAAALGHAQSSVTDIYIDFDQHKVDVANRRVLDWVLYGKK